MKKESTLDMIKQFSKGFITLNKLGLQKEVELKKQPTSTKAGEISE